MVTQRLNNFANIHNIEIGVCHAAPLSMERLMESPFVPFVKKDLQKRINPQLTLPEALSVIIVGVGYEKLGEDNKEGTTALSSLGANFDYHIKVREILKALVNELQHENFKYKILVDTSGLDERQLAERAGIGFFGKNKLIISQKFGSKFNIGCLVTNIPFENLVTPNNKPDKKTSCPPDCNKCIKSCPTNALSTPYLNTKKCVSYLTQKDELTVEESLLLNNQLYGCDICQDVCPFNKPSIKTYVNPNDILTMNEDEFAKEYNKTAMHFGGLEKIKRNALLLTSRRY